MDNNRKHNSFNKERELAPTLCCQLLESYHDFSFSKLPEQTFQKFRNIPILFSPAFHFVKNPISKFGG